MLLHAVAQDRPSSGRSRESGAARRVCLGRVSEMSPVFAAADEEAFEDNSEEYIRRDLEGSGVWSWCLH